MKLSYGSDRYKSVWIQLHGSAIHRLKNDWIAINFVLDKFSIDQRVR